MPLESAPSVRRPSVARRLYACGAAFILAFVAAQPDPRYVFFLPFFPLGLLRTYRGQELRENANTFLVLAWLGYILLATGVVAVRPRLVFWLLFVLLALLLCLNVAGCHAFIREYRPA